MSLDARNKVIKIVSEKLGFSFKEHDKGTNLMILNFPATI